MIGSWCPNGTPHTSPGQRPGYRQGIPRRSEGTPHILE